MWQFDIHSETNCHDSDVGQKWKIIKETTEKKTREQEIRKSSQEFVKQFFS